MKNTEKAVKLDNHLNYSDDPNSDFSGYSERQIWTDGFNHASDIPRFNLGMLKNGMDEDEARDKAFEAWYDAEENSRQYTPFEFTCQILNGMIASERAWEIYEAGITASFEHAWEKTVLRDFTFN